MNRTLFVNRYRDNAEKFLDAIEEFVNLRAEYDANGLSGTLTNGDIVGGDVTAAQFIDAVGSVTAINALFDADHDTNIYRLRRN